MSESSAGGKLALTLGKISQGQRYTLFVSLQVNPTNVGGHGQTVGSSYLAFKSKRARRVLQGEPLIVVQDGEPIERNLHEERLTLDDIMEEARSNEIESLDEIKFAVVEPGGKMSFLKN